ncbi:heme o synthase [Buchnera aphidicola (Pemphigus obesinymphae)]|uniref:heme o synthase n=1 Tax=Buchnera aphidicola TaxID=9 RepID=UPI002236F6A5|nr:heme o synthase [Buchnera aphidicola]MCW5196372.1 heme o synthase [Buchnera aphidicola (Pemphigus obesinymphae)]
MVKVYFLYFLELIKPKIILGNLISLMGAFFLASKGNINYNLFFLTIIGTSLVIASACMMNNIIDRDIDAIMNRTKNRILVQKLLSIKIIFCVAMVFFFIGIYIFYYFINFLSMFFVLIAFFIYVFIYSMYMKRNSVYSTLIGSLSGSIPPVIGYCSVVNFFDSCAFFLFFMFVFWQIVHSYSIAILYFNDYERVNIPLFPIVKGILVAKYHIIFYILFFIFFSLMLTIFGYTGYIYFVCAFLSGFFWLYLGLKGFYILDNVIWSRKLFRFSIVLIFIISIMMSLDFVP